MIITRQIGFAKYKQVVPTIERLLLLGRSISMVSAVTQVPSYVVAFLAFRLDPLNNDYGRELAAIYKFYNIIVVDDTE